MKGQPCLVESPKPLKDGMNLVALCKREIHDAYLAATWDEQRMGTFVLAEPDRTCIKCRKVLAQRLLVPGKRYIYATLPSSEVKRGAEDIE